MNCKARVETRWIRTEEITKKTERVRGRESETDKKRENERKHG